MNEWMNEFFLLGERRDESTSEKSSKKKEGKGSQYTKIRVGLLNAN